MAREVTIQNHQPSAKEEAFNRLIRAMESEEISLRAKIRANKRQIRTLAETQSSLKRELPLITGLLRQVQADREAVLSEPKPTGQPEPMWMCASCKKTTSERVLDRNGSRCVNCGNEIKRGEKIR